MRLLSLRGSLLSRNRSCLPWQDILVLEVDGMDQAVAYWQIYTIARPQDSVRREHIHLILVLFFTAPCGSVKPDLVGVSPTNHHCLVRLPSTLSTWTSSQDHHHLLPMTIPESRRKHRLQKEVIRRTSLNLIGRRGKTCQPKRFLGSSAEKIIGAIYDQNYLA